MVTEYLIEDTTEYPSSSGGGGGGIFRCILQGEENFLTLALQGNYISPPPTNRKNDTSLKESILLLTFFKHRKYLNVIFKGELQRENKLMSYERAFKMLEICI